MSKMIISLLVLCVVLILTSSPGAQSDKVKYVPKYYDPIAEELEENDKREKELKDSVTAEIRDRQEEEKEQEKKDKKMLRFDFTGIPVPDSPEAFKSNFHFPPVAQYRTGTCWSFSGTSFIESEVARLTGSKIKLSEMHTVYYEYVEKVRQFVRERGKSEVWQGSETNAVLRMIRLYGIVPAEIYPGFKEDERHDHARMSEEIRDYLRYVKDNDYWDEESVIESVKLILNRYIGKPPESFEFGGEMTTPIEFSKNVLKINPDDYVDAMSTLSVPFYTRGEFKVHDNWWHDSSYCNIPLNEWYGMVKTAVQNGYTMTIGGDVSEPGYNGFEDAAIVPDFDIPQNYINQDSRELRFYNYTTTDDHGVHLVGYARVGGRDWFLIKDSSKSARWGKHEGYYFYRDDYIRLKMLTIMVHRDVMKDILEKFDEASSG